MLTVNDEQRSEEIPEREINHTQAIRFLKATKLLIFWRKWARKWEVVREKHSGNEANELELDLYRKKESKALGEFFRIHDQKDKKLLNLKSTTTKLSDSWKLANFNLISWRKWAKLRESDRETVMNLI